MSFKRTANLKIPGTTQVVQVRAVSQSALRSYQDRDDGMAAMVADHTFMAITGERIFLDAADADARLSIGQFTAILEAIYEVSDLVGAGAVAERFQGNGNGSAGSVEPAHAGNDVLGAAERTPSG